MIRIAIVDDADVICESLEKFLANFSKNNAINIEFESFYSGKEIMNTLNEKYFDCIFLDIEIGCMNGIDVSRYLRENLKNNTTEIIYISSHSQYAIDLFEFDPITFLLKPIEQEKLIRAFEKFLKRMKINEEVFAFKNGRYIYRIPLKEIIYFESNDHKIILHTIKRDYVFYDKMDRLVCLLEKQRFLSVHKSFLVNSKHIQKYEYENIIVDNGKMIPIAQSKRKNIRELQLEKDIEEIWWRF